MHISTLETPEKTTKSRLNLAELKWFPNALGTKCDSFNWQ